MKSKIIIIGGGIAGLSAGVFGQKHGFETEIFEMHTVPGGQCTAWKRKGYMFDYCIAWLMGSSSGSINTMWKQLGSLSKIYLSLTLKFLSGMKTIKVKNF